MDTPALQVENATPVERDRLEVAVLRFSRLGLRLPRLIVVFHDEPDACGGHPGLFGSKSEPWQISICDSDLGPVYEHELAHAWERANLTDDVRRRFMELRGHPTWDDHSFRWNERGVEGAAFILQQGLGGPPLASIRSREIRSRLAAFELLTGRPDPRLNAVQSWVSDAPDT
jgi:hypothetical protein